MESTSGYSLWLIPGDPMYSRVSRYIEDLANEYDSPLFEPHITIYGQIEPTHSEEELLQTAENLAQNLLPLELRSKGLDYEYSYFRSFFIDIRKTRPLLDIYRQCIERLNLTEKPFYPHLSLIYQRLSEAEKIRLIKQLESKMPGAFAATSIKMMKTEGPPIDWKTMGSYKSNRS